MKPITVAELILQLQNLPQDFIVSAEGCDCEGDAAGARISNETCDDRVLVFRVKDTDQ